MSFNLNRTLGPLQEMWRTMGFEQGVLSSLQRGTAALLYSIYNLELLV